MIKKYGHTKYKRCKRCVMDTSDRFIQFNSQGVCNHCIKFSNYENNNWFPNEEGNRRLNTIFNNKKAKLVNSISSISKRESYLRGFYFKYKNENLVKCLSDQDSSLLKMLAISNCLIKIPANSNKYSKNKLVEIISLPNLF